MVAAGYLTPSRAADLIERHGLRASKRFGQHFLVDPNTVRKIVRLADLDPGQRVLEIGPGLGSLTVGLVEAGASVDVLEVDADVLPALHEVIDGLDVTVHVGDALHTDLDELARGAVLVSNLPYNVATPILARVLDETSIARGVVMVQRELGDRWTAGPGSKTYGAISVKVAFHATAEVVATVPRTVFLPPPKVDSVLVSFQRRAAPPVDVGRPESFFSFVQDAFAHRRKTVRNALADSGHDRATVERALRDMGADLTVRPEAMDLETFARLYRSLA